MKFFRNCAMTAGLMCAASSVQAQQYYPYAAPATLPAPATGVRQMWYEDAAPSALRPTPDSAPEQIAAPSAGAYSGAGSYSGSGSYAPHAGSYAPDYEGAVNGDYAGGGQAGCGCGGGDCADGSCEGDFGYGMDGFGLWTGPACGACGCGPRFFGGVAGLYMTRNKPNPYQMSFDTTNPTGQLILNTDTVGEWTPGAEIRVGVYCGCSSAIEFSAWALDPTEDYASADDPVGIGSLNTPFDFRSLAFNVNGTLVPVTDYYDNADCHHFTRRNEFQNVEINFINWPCACNPCSRVQLSWLAGVRYFHFREGFLFATSASDPFGVNPSGEANLDIDVNNQLLGLQVGNKTEIFLTRGLSVFATPKFGVYLNHMEQHTQIYTGNGLYALNSASDKDNCSFLGQIDVGANYAFNSCLSVYAGYRAMAVSGIALSDAQIPYLQDDLAGYADIDSNSNLVLHGVQAGVTLRY